MLCFHSPHPQAAEWRDLWLTPDQQGAQQLANGQAADAAATFRDPAWRGVAAYEAGTYDQAARSFAGEQTANSFYNLGNALALQGDLRGALNAYEKSLAALPDAEDAIANRDFIQSLLDQQEQEPQDQEGEEQNQEDDSSQRDSESENDKQEQSESSDTEGSDQEPGEDTENQSGSEEEQPADEQREQDSTLADAAERDQEALDAATEEQMAKFDEALEEQQALEQWLRRVPDDPGGLLRRKFRYQTMQRLREGEEPDDSIRW